LRLTRDFQRVCPPRHLNGTRCWQVDFRLLEVANGTTYNPATMGDTLMGVNIGLGTTLSALPPLLPPLR
jgi:hypothetical protein